MLGDVFVMRRERVSLETKWADPYSCSGINIAVEVRPKGAWRQARERTRKDSALLGKAVCK